MEAGQDRGECRPAREGYRGELVLSDAPRNLAGGPTGDVPCTFVHAAGLSRGVLRATVIARGGDRRRMAGEPLHHRDIGPPFQCEYALGSRYLGERGVAPDLRPARGKGGPGAVLTLPLPVVAALMGESDPIADKPTWRRVDRAIETARTKYQSGPGRHDTAPAGDSVEIIGRTRGSRAHPAALRVRASARFVEAARRAQLAGGKGFETVTLADWLGLDLDAQ